MATIFFRLIVGFILGCGYVHASIGNEGYGFVAKGIYSYFEGIPEEAQDAVKPYLLPDNSPLWEPLDKIFGGARVTANKGAMREAGFEMTEDQGLHVVVASHKKLKGYLVKVILDKFDPNTKDKGRDWEHWIRRIEGEKVIRQAVAELGYKKYFKVPRQWIYPLPPGPKCPEKEGYEPKYFILIVEDMRLDSRKANSSFYRSIGKKWLDAIYTITTKYGLSDCCNKHNLPLCRDGKLAFVDTETYHNWPINYHRMVEFLSESGRAYWKTLRQQNGPRN